MARPTSDLLDLFGRRNAGGSGGGARAVSKGRAPDAPKSPWSGRQKLLAGAAGSLALVLAFVGGLAVGQGKRGVGLVNPGAGTTAATVRDTWILRGRALPRIAGVGADNLEKRALAHFASRFPELVTFLTSTAVEEAKGKFAPGMFRLVVRGFPDEKSASEWARHLGAETVGEYRPFQDCRPEKAPR